ncbi:hypothetical protein V8G54_012969 [Vigna mungo]|uniref:EF-hand domain-containing protein n=1 Tax=Vigna mungo TaxID=3915 RepID=A0AAQ3NTV8_VIGMU
MRPKTRGIFEFGGSLISFYVANDGYLDYAHIESGLSALQIPPGYKYAKELFNVCDADRDGRIDYHDFRQYMDGKDAPSTSSSKKNDYKINTTPTHANNTGTTAKFAPFSISDFLLQLSSSKKNLKSLLSNKKNLARQSWRFEMLVGYRQLDSLGRCLDSSHSLEHAKSLVESLMENSIIEDKLAKLDFIMEIVMIQDKFDSIEYHYHSG